MHSQHRNTFDKSLIHVNPTYPVKASGFLRETQSQTEREQLMKIGVLPINDCFFPHFGKREKVRLFYGSYGSGKSVFIADDLIDKCRFDKYFRLFYGRKVFETVRVSQFETFCDRIEERGLTHEFKYSRADNSSMIIHHLPTGNKMIPFGGDRPDKLKSIKDPTHIWCEEFDQFEDGNAETGKQGDFQLLFPRLRTKKAQCEFVASFNTEAVFETHWILKYFFPDLYKGEDKPAEWFLSLMEDLGVCKVFANYVDNKFLDHDEYLKQLQLASGGDQELLNSIAKGAWGVINNKKPWLMSFDKNKHVGTPKFLPAYPIYLSFDFNNDPFACTVWQMSPNKDGNSAFVHCIDEFVGSFKIEDMCAKIKNKYFKSIMFVTGDRSGQNQDVGRNKTLYQLIATELGLSKSQLHLNNSNLEHSDSRAMLNSLFENYTSILIHEKCTNLVSDCKKAKTDEKKAKPHCLLKDRGLYKMDAFDSMRYFFQTYFLEYCQRTYWKRIR